MSGAEADVIVLVEEDGSGRLLTPQDAEVSRVAAIDPTRSAARVSAGAAPASSWRTAARASDARSWRSARSSWASPSERSR